MFSTYASAGHQTKQKASIAARSLVRWRRTNVHSLHEFAFFTFAKAKQEAEIHEPVDYYLEYKDTALTLHFTLAAGHRSNRRACARVFDPAFFIDFKLAEKDPVKLVALRGLPDEIAEAERRGTASAQKLNEQTFMGDGRHA